MKGESKTAGNITCSSISFESSGHTVFWQKRRIFTYCKKFCLKTRQFIVATKREANKGGTYKSGLHFHIFQE